ncbi:hypothetical protein O181_038814 [Austropuccinia psidii MF-1]|uniref:ATP-dependent (S)-NAD(P)H-hydrate dehydratase n=1 Tax=Austropuccinia psidii MF-1 TaxID=1389203 RepID=A0A9Q3D929_9BASI|nr:hypothetical protein [Austropuccinia psidii MF-1]
MMNAASAAAASKAARPSASRIIPPLDGSLHKGQAGRVAVVGGSKDYTGAPFFSSYSSLRLGADLSHVICDPVASSVIKAYSPDLMVHSWLSPSTDSSLYSANQKEFKDLMDRLHVLVIGPGLGRDNEMQTWATWAIKEAIQKRLHLVLDADALWLLQNKPDIIKDYPNVIITPNLVEFQRLLSSCSINVDEKDPEKLAQQLSSALGGCTVLQKASTDLIARVGFPTIKVSFEGSPKRSGGQGDILSGLVGTWVAWGKLYHERQSQKEDEGFEDEITPEDIPVIAATFGSKITRACSRLAYENLGRSMQASDMLGHVAVAFQEVMYGQPKNNDVYS